MLGRLCAEKKETHSLSRECIQALGIASGVVSRASEPLAINTAHMHKSPCSTATAGKPRLSLPSEHHALGIHSCWCPQCMVTRDTCGAGLLSCRLSWGMNTPHVFREGNRALTGFPGCAARQSRWLPGSGSGCCAGACGQNRAGQWGCKLSFPFGLSHGPEPPVS